MKKLFEKVKAAIEADPKVIIPKDKLSETTGYPLSYWDILGLSKTDMKKLERKGLAIRGYVYSDKGGYETRFVLVLV